jgi:thioredoxin reductase (NADPH)
LENRDLVIIGGGPAGLAAGLYAGRAELKTVLLEKAMTGGMAATTAHIENYPGFPAGIGGVELAAQMEEQARKFGVEIGNAQVEEVLGDGDAFTVRTDEGEWAAKTVILATGASPSLLGAPGEKEFLGRGVSFCATCDGAFFRDQAVVVVGGGDAAVEEAMFLTRFASRVFVVHRRGELRATRIIQDRAFKNPKLEFVWFSTVDSIRGGGKVEEVVVKDVRSGEQKVLAAGGVFIYVGNRPNSDLVADLADLDERGYVKTDAEMRTRAAGLFAAGDVRRKSLRQVITAVADGAVAAVSAEKYLAEKA